MHILKRIRDVTFARIYVTLHALNENISRRAEKWTSPYILIITKTRRYTCDVRHLQGAYSKLPNPPPHLNAY